VRSRVGFIVIMITRARVHVGVADTEATTDISTKTVGQNLLVLWQDVSLVGARTGHINTTGLDIWLVAKSELWNLTNTVFGVSLILEVKITQ
jgi:hypothetical protein